MVSHRATTFHHISASFSLLLAIKEEFRPGYVIFDAITFILYPKVVNCRIKCHYNQRIQIAWMLDSFGVDQIEISPVVSPDHFEATKTIIKQDLRADIIAHTRALKSDIDIAIDCNATWIATYMGISDIHLSAKLKITREEAKIRALEVADYI